jgi:HD-GYP domain-containing protein (c-di-GMP phosphodiesterase class II)
MGVEKILTSWVERLETAGIESKGHNQRVMELTARVAKQLGVDNQNMVHLMRGAKLHDLGLLGLPGRNYWPADPDRYLTDQHYPSHPEKAHELLKSISYLNRSLETVLYHHEHWDGTGFPEGRKGKEIPLSARIVAAVEVYDTLTHGLPGKESLHPEQVIKFLNKEAGQRFDPDIINALVKMI